MSLAPSPTLLAKNKWEDHRLQSVLILAWQHNDIDHVLCPVQALHKHNHGLGRSRPSHSLHRPRITAPGFVGISGVAFRWRHWTGGSGFSPQATRGLTLGGVVSFPLNTLIREGERSGPMTLHTVVLPALPRPPAGGHRMCGNDTTSGQPH